MRPSLRRFTFATFATLIAGFVDAVGYAHLGGLFLSFMSGNSTRLGIQLADADWAHVGFTAGVIGSFVGGAFLGTTLSDAVGEMKLILILCCEVVMFAIAWALVFAGIGYGALLPVALAMGMQNSVHQVIAGADVGKSFVTGALFGLGQSLSRFATRRETPQEAASYAASWASFVTGAAIGALVLAWSSLSVAMGGACLLLAGLAALAYAFHGHLPHAVGQVGGD
ncbi:YoaK family protein [Ancylobacter pratisalsi]|uniref:DUF1275 domain-containing protein n=1 Tax=Ancylobacter pratisalsi TaxID=1745854 RepID=A0A6P1YKE3_9HYPH|nr:YoaK family protein [Ancylobacter pratisalsi]QIB33798.1 DUF1275 domain-containing protein [Ancylobacter pratisalsi]